MAGLIVLDASVLIAYLDGEDISASEFYTILARDPHFPRTSQPSVPTSPTGTRSQTAAAVAVNADPTYTG